MMGHHSYCFLDACSVPGMASRHRPTPEQLCEVAALAAAAWETATRLSGLPSQQQADVGLEPSWDLKDSFSPRVTPPPQKTFCNV